MGAKPAIPDARQLKAAREEMRGDAALIIAKSTQNILRSKRLILASARAARHPRRHQ